MKGTVSATFAALASIFCIYPTTAFSVGDCKSFHMVRQHCRWIAGTLFIYNGWPPNTRVQPNGSKQVYGVGPDPEEGLMPSYLMDALEKSELTSVKGQFEICPFGNHFRDGDQTDDEPDLSTVCIQNAKDLSYYDPKSRGWVKFTIPADFRFVNLPKDSKIS